MAFAGSIEEGFSLTSLRDALGAMAPAMAKGAATGSAAGPWGALAGALASGAIQMAGRGGARPGAVGAPPARAAPIVRAAPAAVPVNAPTALAGHGDLAIPASFLASILGAIAAAAPAAAAAAPAQVPQTPPAAGDGSRAPAIGEKPAESEELGEDRGSRSRGRRGAFEWLVASGLAEPL